MSKTNTMDQEGEEEEELWFELVDAKYSRSSGITCHIIASWEKENIENPQSMLEAVDNIEVFQCFGEEEGEEGDEEEEEDGDRGDGRDEEEEDDDRERGRHEEGDEDEGEPPIEKLNDEKKLEYIKRLTNATQQKGGGTLPKKSPQLIKTTNLVKFLSKPAKQ